MSPQPAPSEGGFVRHVVTFGRILREAGLEVGPGRISDALTGLDCLDIRNRDDVYWALRTTLVSRAEELESFDRAFAAWFLRSPSRPPYRGTLPVDKPPRLSERTRTDRTGNDDRPRRRSPPRSAGAATRSCGGRTLPR